jgi:hypothetical protein
MAEADKNGGGGEAAPGGLAKAAKPSKRANTTEQREDREKRLAEALRANLRRRKAGKKD